MNKEEILKKAKRTKASDLDEMEMQIMLKANRLAVIAGFIICIILMTVKMIAGQPYYDCLLYTSIITFPFLFILIKLSCFSAVTPVIG